MSEIIDALNQLERAKKCQQGTGDGGDCKNHWLQHVRKIMERMYLWKHIWTVRLVRSQLYARRKL